MIIKFELKNNMKTFLIWLLCVAGLDIVMLLMFPEMKSALEDMASTVDGMGAMGTAFGMDRLNVGQPEGFYGSYVGAVLSLVGAMYAAIIGTASLSKEEAGHTAEYLFTLPYSRKNIVLQKIISVAILVVAFDVINYLVGIVGLQMITDRFSMERLTIYHFAQLLMHLEVAGICLMISAFSKKLNAGIGLGFAMLLYFLDMLARISSKVKFIRFITPFYYANAADVMVEGKINGMLTAVGMAAMIACLIAGIRIYTTRDLAA